MIVVSVVLRCVPPAGHLGDALASLLAQTFTAWECVVVADGAAADLPADPRFRVVPSAGRGPSEARNAGIRAARGRYLLPLDSTDRLAPTMLERTVGLLEGDTALAIGFTHVQRFGASEEVEIRGPFTLSAQMQESRVPYCALYRRAVWDAVGGYDPALDGCEEWDFWLGALQRGFRGALVPEALFQRRAGAAEVAAEEGRPALLTRIVLKHRELFPSWTVEEARRQIAGTLPAPLRTRPPAPAPLVPPSPSAPTVSVIMPTRNRPELLGRALRSVLEQTFQDFEIIVVNDAGQPVERVIDGLDPAGRIHYVSAGRNRGLPGARNLGLRIARGRYVAYLDDDDLFYPDHLETLVAALRPGTHSVAYTDAHRLVIREEGGRLVEVSRDVPYSHDFDRRRLLAGNLTPVTCVMHERTCLEAVGVFDESLGVTEDWELWMRVSARSPFVHVRRVTCAYSWRTDGVGMSNERRSLFGLIERLLKNRHGAYDGAYVRPEEIWQERIAQLAAHVVRRVGGLEGVRSAIAGLEQGASGGALDAGAHHKLALLRSALGGFDAAAEDLRRALALEPRHEAARVLLATLCLTAGRKTEALRLVAESLRENPRDPAALLLAGDINVSLGRVDRALAFYDVLQAVPGAEVEGTARIENLRRADQGLVSSRQSNA